jgi:hypothetical protein
MMKKTLNTATSIRLGPRHPKVRCALAIALGLLLAVQSGHFVHPAVGEVVRFEITQRAGFASGQTFGDVGPYEIITGRVHYALDPQGAANEHVVDLKLAPREADGRVHFSGDLFILAPQDLRKGNGALLYDVNNRGNKLALRFFNLAGGGNNPRQGADAGDGFLMRQGFTIVWSGWDGELLDAPERLKLKVPVAKSVAGPITGLVRCEFVPSRDTTRMPVVNWDNHGSYRPTAAGLATATLTHRERPDDQRVEIPRDQWKLHVTELAQGDPSQLPLVEVELPAGLQQGHIYELICEAQDPLVQGVGFTAVRDLIAAIKQGTGRDNPLLVEGRPVIRRAHGFGVSQSGRFLREFLYWGFNADESGRKVFEGVIPHVSGSGMGSFNHRFAQPTRHCTQHDHADYPADRFPFAYETQTDPLSGRTDGILRRAEANGTVPLVMHTQSAAEYWTRSGSLSHTDPRGHKDARPPDTVRVYLFGGTQHGPAAYPPEKGLGQNLANPGDYRPFLRALLLKLDAWAKEGQSPPPSVYPTIAAGTLVPWERKSAGFPAIPGVKYPQVIRQPWLLDFGPRWYSQGIVDYQPPQRGPKYGVLVPKCGPDGNELGCLSPPEVAVPVATHTGWNLRRKDVGAEDQLVSLTGSYIPFATTKAQREKSGDPRPSLEERYGTLERYLEVLAAKCRELEQAGYLLPEDVERTVAVQRDRVAPLFAEIGKE